MNAERRRDFARNRMPIVDQDALATVLEALIQERGSQQAAADAIGVDAGTYSKLRTGQRSGIEFATYERLAAQLGRTVSNNGRPPMQLLEFPVVSSRPRILSTSQKEAVRRVAEVNRRWEAMLEARRAFHAARAAYRAAAGQADGVEFPMLDGLAEMDLPQLTAEQSRRNELWTTLQKAVLTEAQQFAWEHYEAWMTSEVRRIQDRSEPVLASLWEHPAYREILSEFLKKLGRPPDRLPDRVLDQRCWLALLRAVEPLGAHGETWRMEYGWRDLHQLDELGAYLNAALRRESLLFDQVREMERVRRARPPYSKAEWLSLQYDDDAP